MEDFSNTLTSWKWFMLYRKSHDKGDAKPWSGLSRWQLRHNLREAEEERGGANEEESGRRHRDIPGGTQGSAVRNDGVGEWRWGWNPPSTLTAATWHHFLRRFSGCCGVSFTTSQCFTTGLWGRQCYRKNVRHVNERALSVTWEKIVF